MGNLNNSTVSNFQNIIDNSNYMICQFDCEGKNYDGEGNEIYHIYSKSKFGTLDYCDCYDENGHIIGHKNAKEIDFDNYFTRKAIIDNHFELRNFLLEKLNIISDKYYSKEDIIEMLELWLEYYTSSVNDEKEYWGILFNEYLGHEEVTAKAFIDMLDEWFDENLEDDNYTVKGMTYWNGTNFVSNILKGSLGADDEVGNLIELEHNEFYAKMIEAWENSETVSGDTYGYNNEYDNYKFYISHNPNVTEDATCYIS